MLRTISCQVCGRLYKTFADQKRRRMTLEYFGKARQCSEDTEIFIFWLGEDSDLGDRDLRYGAAGKWNGYG